ncbi:MAG: 5-oxoprolinase subunit PxpB [Phycisphaerales bacterium]
MASEFEYQWTSERSLRVCGPASPAVIADALRTMDGVIDAAATESAAYARLDPLASVSLESMDAQIDGLSARAPAPPVVHEIPVCYDPPFGLDLDSVARQAGMAVDEVVGLHTSTRFTVAFLGFAPGFGYLSGLPERLHVSRLSSPRARVDAGSVGIAGPYSGAYALPGPGGWRVIGRTSMRLFDTSRDSPALLQAGDVVRFRAVTAGEIER